MDRAIFTVDNFSDYGTYMLVSLCFVVYSSTEGGPPAVERLCTALVLLRYGPVIRFPFYIFCCWPQGTCAFIWMAGIVRGSVGGACINNFTLLYVFGLCLLSVLRVRVG